MKRVYLIVDCSGSIISDDTAQIGTINDLIRDVIEELETEGANDIRIVCYANGAKMYWQSSEKTGFLDITENKFGGRSNLGKAYELIRQDIENDSVELQDCAFILLSDGEATDNYKKELLRLDPKKKAYRVALSLGSQHITTEKHAFNDELSFSNGIIDRDDFIEKTVEFISK